MKGITPNMNDTEHPNRQQAQQSYLNQVNVHKHHTPQHTVPVQSAYFTSSPLPRNGLQSLQAASVYHFSHHHHHHHHHSQQVTDDFEFNFERLIDSTLFSLFSLHYRLQEEDNQDLKHIVKI